MVALCSQQTSTALAAPSCDGALATMMSGTWSRCRPSVLTVGLAASPVRRPPLRSSWRRPSSAQAVPVQHQTATEALLRDAESLLRARFRIPAAEVQQTLQQYGCSAQELLLALMEPASQLARPPISQFHVGAVGLGGSGAVYVGVNLEFPGVPLNQSVHAEQFLVANLLRAGEEELQMLAVTAAPCGHCRQFYSELACADHVRFMFGHQQVEHGHQHQPEHPLQQQQHRRGRPIPSYGLADLLPMRFGPPELLGRNSGVPLLLQRQAHPLAWHAAAQQALQARSHDASFLQLADAALKAATESYAPYTHCYAGAAVLCEDGSVHSGSYLESAAYNPGLLPVQAAFAAAVMDGLTDLSQVRQVVIAERQDGIVQQARMAQELARAAVRDPALPVVALAVQQNAAHVAAL